MYLYREDSKTKVCTLLGHMDTKLLEYWACGLGFRFLGLGFRTVAPRKPSFRDRTKSLMCSPCKGRLGGIWEFPKIRGALFWGSL